MTDIDIQPRPALQRSTIVRELLETIILIGLVYTYRHPALNNPQFRSSLIE